MWWIQDQTPIVDCIAIHHSMSTKSCKSRLRCHTSLNQMESFHDLSWHVMIYHDKPHVLSWNITKYHMSWNVTKYNWKIFHVMTCPDVVNVIQSGNHVMTWWTEKGHSINPLGLLLHGPWVRGYCSACPYRGVGVEKQFFHFMPNSGTPGVPTCSFDLFSNWFFLLYPTRFLHVLCATT